MPPALKLAFRRLARHLGFCLVSTLLLALGVAVSTLSFAITDSALLRPLPFPLLERLFRVFATTTQDAFLLYGMPDLPVPGVAAQLLLGLAFVVVGAAACYLASRRAVRVSPVEVLRVE